MALTGTALTGAFELFAEAGGWETLLLAAIPTFVLLGVLDGLFGSDQERQPDESQAEPDDDGSMFGSDEDGDLAFDDGADPFEDDEFGDEGDEFGDMGGGPDVSDLEMRVDELEEELSQLSSTVSTVRTENEQIGESVEDIEENIRKLLDIYKMVTKGVNPFVDQQGGNLATAVDDDSLGLFEDETTEEEEELDEEVMETDAEEFFDDDFGDDGSIGDPDKEDMPDDTFEPLEESDDESITDDPETTAETDEETDARGFEELKEAYDDTGDFEEDSESTPEQEEPPETTESNDSPDTTNKENSQPDDQRATFQTPTDPKPAAEREPLAETTDGRPYLKTIPAGFTEELLALEWIEFLVEESGPQEAYSALIYYERIGWLGADAGDHLRQLLSGHPAVTESVRGTGGPLGLSAEQHTQSLRYVAQLAGGNVGPRGRITPPRS